MVTTGAVLSCKTRRTVVRNLKQFIAVILIAALAACLFTGFIANAQALQDRVAELYDSGNIADIWVYTSGFDDGADDLSMLKNLSGVSNAEGRFVVVGMYDDTRLSALVTTNNEINKPASITDGAAGLLITESFAAETGLDVGGEFIFECPVPAAAAAEFADAAEPLVREGKTNIFRGRFFRMKFTVTGIMTHPECVTGAMSGGAYFLAEKETFCNVLGALLAETYNLTSSPSADAITSLPERLSRPNQFVLTIAAGASRSAVESAIRTAFAGKSDGNFAGVYDVDNIASNAGLMSDITQAKQMTYVFPMIFFFVALLIILTTVSQVIIRERMQIGVMKALGLSDARILLHYIMLAVALVTIGFFIGVAVGPVLIPNVMNNKYDILFSLPALRYVFPAAEIALCYGVFLFATVAVSIAVCRKETKKLPSESLRPNAPDLQKAAATTPTAAATAASAAIAATTAVTGAAASTTATASTATTAPPTRPYANKKFRMPSKMAFRNILTAKARSVMVIAGIVGCISLLICGFGIEDTIAYGTHNDMQVLFPYDIDVGGAARETEISLVEGVAYAERYTYLPATVEGKATAQTMARVVKARSQICPLEFDIGTVAVSAKIARDTGLSMGSDIAFEVSGARYTSTVGLIYDAFYYHGIILYDTAYPALAEFGNGVFVKLDEGADGDMIAEKIRAGGGTAVTRAEFLAVVDDMLSGITLMTMTLKVFAVFLAVVVLYNIALLNYSERQRDIATMKVLGFNKREIAVSLILEIMFLTVIGAVVGLFFGLPMTVLVMSINETPIVSFLYNVKPLSYALGLLITVGTSIAVNVVLANLTDRVQMIESLKSYE
jgi:putative ABC transport system permease protein